MKGQDFSTKKGKQVASLSSQKHQLFSERSPESSSKIFCSGFASVHSYKSCNPDAPAPIIAISYTSGVINVIIEVNNCIL